ncbi:Uncharacterised protein [uncultured archaeon]|nr:Uncharacterised protein [uncultured archaeon]
MRMGLLLSSVNVSRQRPECQSDTSSDDAGEERRITDFFTGGIT